MVSFYSRKKKSLPNEIKINEIWPMVLLKFLVSGVAFFLGLPVQLYTAKTGVLNLTPVGVNRVPHPQVLTLHTRVST